MLRKLSHREEFDMALRGHVRARTEHFVFHLSSNSLEQETGLGSIVPKRWAKRAVTRNLIKREIREQAEQHLQELLPGSLGVVRLAATFSRDQYKSASSSLLGEALRAELCILYARTVAKQMQVNQKGAAA